MIPLPLVWGTVKSVPWRGIAYGLAAVAVAVLAWRVYAWREAYVARDATEAEVERIRSEYASRLATMETNWRSAQDASKGDLNELETLRSQPRPTAPIVRVCRPTSPRVPAPTGTTGRPDGPATEAGSVPGSDLLDTSALLGVGDRCDEISARLRALQAWVSTTTAGQ